MCQAVIAKASIEGAIVLPLEGGRADIAPPDYREWGEDSGTTHRLFNRPPTAFKFLPPHERKRNMCDQMSSAHTLCIFVSTTVGGTYHP